MIVYISLSTPLHHRFPLGHIIQCEKRFQENKNESCGTGKASQVVNTNSVSALLNTVVLAGEGEIYSCVKQL